MHLHRFNTGFFRSTAQSKNNNSCANVRGPVPQFVLSCAKLGGQNLLQMLRTAETFDIAFFFMGNCFILLHPGTPFRWGEMPNRTCCNLKLTTSHVLADSVIFFEPVERIACDSIFYSKLKSWFHIPCDILDLPWVDRSWSQVCYIFVCAAAGHVPSICHLIYLITALSTSVRRKLDHVPSYLPYNWYQSPQWWGAGVCGRKARGSGIALRRVWCIYLCLVFVFATGGMFRTWWLSLFLRPYLYVPKFNQAGRICPHRSVWVGFKRYTRLTGLDVRTVVCVFLVSKCILWLRLGFGWFWWITVCFVRWSSHDFLQGAEVGIQIKLLNYIFGPANNHILNFK